MYDDTDHCPRCKRQVGDHTLRQFRDCHPTKDLDLPFEESPLAASQLETLMAGGLIVLAAVMDTALGKVPTLVFRFVKGNGIEMFPDMTLVGDAAMMHQTSKLVAQAARAAVKASESA
jgi:hypothetical protein